jgi:hypothetical protein
MYHHGQELLPRGNSKLCFLLQKMLFAAENQLAPVLMAGVYGCLQSRLPV